MNMSINGIAFRCDGQMPRQTNKQMYGNSTCINTQQLHKRVCRVKGWGRPKMDPTPGSASHGRDASGKKEEKKKNHKNINKQKKKTSA